MFPIENLSHFDLTTDHKPRRGDPLAYKKFE